MRKQIHKFNVKNIREFQLDHMVYIFSKSFSEESLIIID